MALGLMELGLRLVIEPDVVLKLVFCLLAFAGHVGRGQGFPFLFHGFDELFKLDGAIMQFFVLAPGNL